MRTTCAPDQGKVIETDIPARLDRLPWGGFHRLVIVALGVTWILDGLEVTLAGSVAGALKSQPGAAFDRRRRRPCRQRLSRRRGDRRPVLRLAHRPARPQKAVFHHHRALSRPRPRLTGLAWSTASFFAFRFLTGAGIGGEYSAINSTIQELVPARYRGFTDLVINGSFWLGAALGALVAVVLLNPALSIAGTRLAARLPDRRGVSASSSFSCACGFRKARAGWRCMGARRRREDVVAGIEQRVSRRRESALAPPDERGRSACARETERRSARCSTSCSGAIAGAPWSALTLMAAQAFFYNAIFFTYALVLTKFYGVPAGRMSAGTSCRSRSAISSARSCSGRLFDTLGPQAR